MRLGILAVAPVVLLCAVSSVHAATVPVSACLASKLKCVAKYASAVAKCDFKAATKDGIVSDDCLVSAASKLGGSSKGCLDKAALSEDCATAGSQNTQLQQQADDFIDGALCVIDPSIAGCPTTTTTTTTTEPPLLTWYRDLDEDGHGNPADSTMAAMQPVGYVANPADDCDDSDPYRYPGNNEVCDLSDNDCNPGTSEACPSGCSPVVSGNLFLKCTVAATWPAAKSVCQGQGMRLARIDASGENSALVLGMMGNDFWAGGSDINLEGTWEWIDGATFYQSGSAILYANWNAFEPNNSGGNEDCLMVTSGGGWNDATCLSSARYYCERY